MTSKAAATLWHDEATRPARLTGPRLKFQWGAGATNVHNLSEGFGLVIAGLTSGVAWGHVVKNSTQRNAVGAFRSAAWASTDVRVHDKDGVVGLNNLAVRRHAETERGKRASLRHSSGVRQATTGSTSFGLLGLLGVTAL